MIWYATFPRCGNSYAQNILCSAGYDLSPKIDKEAQVCKTHGMKKDKNPAIHQIRHPLDVYCSMRVFYGKSLSLTLKEMEDYEKHYDFYKDRDNTVLVRYEYALNYPDIVITAAKMLGEEPTKDNYMLPTFAQWRDILPDGKRRLQKGVANRYIDELGKDAKKVIKALKPLCDKMEYKIEL